MLVVSSSFHIVSVGTAKTTYFTVCAGQCRTYTNQSITFTINAIDMESTSKKVSFGVFAENNGELLKVKVKLYYKDHTVELEDGDWNTINNLPLAYKEIAPVGEGDDYYSNSVNLEEYPDPDDGLPGTISVKYKDNQNDRLTSTLDICLCRTPDCLECAPFNWLYGLLGFMGLCSIYVYRKKFS